MTQDTFIENRIANGALSALWDFHREEGTPEEIIPEFILELTMFVGGHYVLEQIGNEFLWSYCQNYREERKNLKAIQQEWEVVPRG